MISHHVSPCTCLTLVSCYPNKICIRSGSVYYGAVGVARICKCCNEFIAKEDTQNEQLVIVLSSVQYVLYVFSDSGLSRRHHLTCRYRLFFFQHIHGAGTAR